MSQTIFQEGNNNKASQTSRSDDSFKKLVISGIIALIVGSIVLYWLGFKP